MSLATEIEDDIKAGIVDVETAVANLKLKLSPTAQADVKAAENAGHEVVSTAWSYIKSNGLSDLYDLAVTLLTGTSGTPWGQVLTTIKSKAISDGIQLLEGSEAVVAAQVQADLIAVGKLLPPVASTAPSSASGTAA